jgi:hypothetical protein
MSDELPEIDKPRQHLKITEAELAPPPVSSARLPTPPPPTATPAPTNARPAPADAPAHSPTSGRSAADGGWTEATRLMCAAAYLDGTFAQDVVDEVIDEQHRAVHIPFGVDIEPVAKHCLAARRRKTTRDLLLFLDLIFALVALFASSGGLLFVAVLVAWAIVFVDMWRSTFSTVVKKLSVHAFSPQDAPPALDPRMTKRIEELAASQDGNTTVYSGFLPFVGAGYEMEGWSFVVDLCKAKAGMGADFKPSAVDPQEIYAAIRQAVEDLALPNLTVEDRLYVQGTDIRGDPALLPSPTGRPATNVDQAVLESMIGSSAQRIRHYQCIRVIDWRGELVVSLYLRFPIHSDHMFCEYNNFLLTPLKEQLHRADGLRMTIELRQALAILGRSAVATIGLWPRSPRLIFKPLTSGREARRKLKEAERNPLFDHGASHTALDRVRSTEYRRFFQRVDKEMYVKLLERMVLDTIIEVLSHHGIDTSLIDESRATIINNGVMTGGGSIHTENLAAGAGAGIINRVRGAMSATRGGTTPRQTVSAGGEKPRSGGGGG